MTDIDSAIYKELGITPPVTRCTKYLGNHDYCGWSAVDGTEYCETHEGGREFDPVAVANLLAGGGTFDDKVAERVESLRVTAEARRRLAAENAAEHPILAPVPLADLLAEPDEEAAYLVGDVWPADGRVLFAAQFKAGKTTMVGNLVRSLADGDLFLDTYKSRQVERVVLLDDELSPRMVKQWLREQDIQHPDRVAVMPMRGRLSGFDVTSPEVRAKWVEAIGPADVLIVDCLRPLMDALGLNEHSEAGVVLTGLDELMSEAGIGQLMVVHHMGHQNERSRGDSRLLDWPDALWTLVRQDEDPASQRFFKAYGRDVDVPEVGLSYEPEGRRLRVTGGNRGTVAVVGRMDEVLAFVQENPACSGRAVTEGLGGDNKVIRAALKALVRSGRVAVEVKGKAHLHTAVPSAEEVFGDD